MFIYLPYIKPEAIESNFPVLLYIKYNIYLYYYMKLYNFSLFFNCLSCSSLDACCNFVLAYNSPLRFFSFTAVSAYLRLLYLHL